jgi:hypothetical protein
LTKGGESFPQHVKVPGAEQRLLGLAAAESPVGSSRPERQYRGDVGCGRPDYFSRRLQLLTSSKYAKLTKCSQDTAHRDIQALVERGVLVQNPEGGRSTSYSLAPGQ